MDYIKMLNLLAEIRQNLAQDNALPNYERSLNRIFSMFEEEGFICHSPLGEKYLETRTDCEAIILGKISDNMVITQVVKPVIYKKSDNGIDMLQAGFVIAESETKKCKSHESS